jgi:hypothetical protein
MTGSWRCRGTAHPRGRDSVVAVGVAAAAGPGRIVATPGQPHRYSKPPTPRRRSASPAPPRYCLPPALRGVGRWGQRRSHAQGTLGGPPGQDWRPDCHRRRLSGHDRLAPQAARAEGSAAAPTAPTTTGRGTARTGGAGRGAIAAPGAALVARRANEDLELLAGRHRKPGPQASPEAEVPAATAGAEVSGRTGAARSPAGAEDLDRQRASRGHDERLSRIETSEGETPL